MKTDIQIAQEAAMLPIKEVAASYGIVEDDLELYGKYKAKLSDELMERVKDRPDGKLVLVTAINPTPAGEGKTTITVGLGEAMAKLGKKALIALREPSLGPCFGIKGGAAGGGYGLFGHLLLEGRPVHRLLRPAGADLPGLCGGSPPLETEYGAELGGWHGAAYGFGAVLLCVICYPLSLLSPSISLHLEGGYVTIWMTQNPNDFPTTGRCCRPVLFVPKGVSTP